MAEENRAYFSAAEVQRLLNVDKNELRAILRTTKIKSGPNKGKIMPPLFTPESEFHHLVGDSFVFTQKDIVAMSRYFRAVREFDAARDELRRKGIEARKKQGG